MIYFKKVTQNMPLRICEDHSHSRPINMFLYGSLDTTIIL